MERYLMFVAVGCLVTGLPSSGTGAVELPPGADLTPAEVAGQQHYGQPYRPQFHYTPIQGHLGDATGLIYYRGEYHLFHMFDPWGQARRDRHKCWGHAISRDLLSWEQQPPVLDAIIDNRPGSGSGVVDWNNTSGLRTGPQKTLLIFYTDYRLGSSIAYSNDCGRTWTRYGRNPVLAGTDDIRDPTVFPDPKDMGLSLAAEGGEMCAVSLEVNRLESIWLERGTKSVSAGLLERAGTGAARGP